VIVAARRHALVLLSIVAGISSITGCATYRKCGFSGCPEDASLTSEVQQRFSDHAILQPPNLLTVQVHDHVVYLYGLVDTQLQREIAESIARETPGVTKVVNSIGISGNR
jgi:osmotically-inducible protein OsmY